MAPTLLGFTDLWKRQTLTKQFHDQENKVKTLSVWGRERDVVLRGSNSEEVAPNWRIREDFPEAVALEVRPESGETEPRPCAEGC